MRTLSVLLECLRSTVKLLGARAMLGIGSAGMVPARSNVAG